MATEEAVSQPAVTPAPPAVTADDTGVPGVTKEAYETLKKLLDEKTRDLAEARARSTHFEEKERARISAFQPAAAEFVEELMKDADPEVKADLAPLQTWAGEFHQKEDIIAQAPLARLVDCASKKLKRTRDEASAHSEQAASLSNSMRELEETKSERDTLRQRVGELEVLASERQDGLEKLQAELAKAGLMQDRFDFSKLTSREKTPAAGKEAESAMPPAATPVGGIKTETSNASRGAPTDRLLSEIVRRGGGSLRVTGSGTAHALLGNSNPEGDLMAALRMA